LPIIMPQLADLWGGTSRTADPNQSIANPGDDSFHLGG
jgi:hypothetical protein